MVKTSKRIKPVDKMKQNKIDTLVKLVKYVNQVVKKASQIRKNK